ncbi:beta-xylosidase [uncultured Mucilaginibacter sp.]|uniref:GH39 family glycosyl hydrolase n=1 Tax=uncultured Mucilaginibacter sp. TaxID=797541 RepID=UPI00261FB033|nr:beta-xylosidase [uncultured Mucilaginibacter sp.]
MEKWLPKVLFFVIVFALARPVNAQHKASIQVDLNKTIAPLKPVWAWFGNDEPNYAYMKDGQKLLTELSALSPVPVYLRTHNLMTSGDGTAALKWGSTNIYTEDKNGKPVYDFTIVDRIFDAYVKRGMKPLAQIGFMPEALSTHPQPYQHHWQPGHPYQEIITGWAYPPKDYQKWGELVYQWVKHCVKRYGQKEVESWYWEVWNEPNGDYWKASVPEFYKLYDYAADGVKRALLTAKVGGPDVAGTGGAGGSKFLRGFIQHCLTDTNNVTGKIGSPLDVVLFHAKGSPRVVDGVVRMNMGTQLRDIETGFQIVKSFPQTQNLPIIIGESDPEGCAACGMQTNPENAYRNGTLFSSYTAASFAREYLLANEYGVNFKGAVSWSFEFEDQPWFAGFRDLATNGVDKPVLNVFRMFGMMKGNRVEANGTNFYPLKTVRDSSVRNQTDIGAFASKDKNQAAIMVWNYHDDDVQENGNTAIAINGIPSKQIKLTEYRIDQNYSNSYEVWKKMGSPQKPTSAQISTLEKAGMLQTAGNPKTMTVENGKITMDLNLPRQAVVLLKLEWK